MRPLVDDYDSSNMASYYADNSYPGCEPFDEVYDLDAPPIATVPMWFNYKIHEMGTSHVENALGKCLQNIEQIKGRIHSGNFNPEQERWLLHDIESWNRRFKDLYAELKRRDCQRKTRPLYVYLHTEGLGL